MRLGAWSGWCEAGVAARAGGPNAVVCLRKAAGGGGRWLWLRWWWDKEVNGGSVGGNGAAGVPFGWGHRASTLALQGAYYLCAGGVVRAELPPPTRASRQEPVWVACLKSLGRWFRRPWRLW